MTEIINNRNLSGIAERFCEIVGAGITLIFSVKICNFPYLRLSVQRSKTIKTTNNKPIPANCKWF